MKVLRKLISTTLAMSGLLVALSGCQKPEGPAEKAGKEVDRAMETTGQQVDKAVEKVGEQVKKAGESIQDAAKDDKK